MDAVSDSEFRRNLRKYMKKVNEDAETLIVTADDPEDSVVVLGKREYDAMQETLYIMSNPTLMPKIRRGDEQFKDSKAHD